MPSMKMSVRAVHGAIPVLVQEMRAKRARIEQGIKITNLHSMQALNDWLMTGCFVNEQHFSWDPPTVEETKDLIIIHENCRML